MRLRSFAVALAATLAVAMPSHAYRVAAWITPWDDASLTSVQLHAGQIQESNPVWYSLSADGSIVTNWNAENPTWRAAMVGTQLLPTIQNVVAGSFSASVAQTVLATVDSREKHAEAIFQLVVSKGFDGIDVDYERVPTTSRDQFTAFITTLSNKLHVAGKKLSVTVYAKTSDSQNWNGPGSQDWVKLGAAADFIKIMAYDYSWATSAAGPITPLDWLDKVAAYSMAAIPPAKISMGLPWYGYDWVGTAGKGIVYTQAIALASANNATITRDINGEAKFSYADHVVYFQDGAAYQRKVDLLRQKYPTMGGFSHWRTGNEDPQFWTVLANLNGGGGATTPAGDFTIAAPSSISVTAGQSVTASYSAVRVNNFADPIAVTVQAITPIAATLSLSRSSLTTSASSSTLTLATTSATAAGTYSVRVKMTSGSLVRESVLTVTVLTAPKKRAARK